jgi:hypothetical protein
MPTVFASVSVTVTLFFLAILGMAYGHVLAPYHMLLGFFMATMLILLQCLIFGFFIGSGKSIKQKVQEFGLSPNWVQKTKDYKNKSYPALMLAIVVMAAAAVLGGGVGAGSVPVWLHQTFIWLALVLNVRSLWISYKTIVENVEAIHRMNAEIETLREGGKLPVPSVPPISAAPSIVPSRPNPSANFYFLAAAVWVPYLYMKVSLGSRTFPFWPFLVTSFVLWVAGFLRARKTSKH